MIFACDHRHNVEWNLPYVRFGGLESDCAIKCQNKVFDIDVNADETPKLFWLWQNIDLLANDGIIGYCLYRRFFTVVAAKTPVLNIRKDLFKKEFAMTPFLQEALIRKHNVDGILHPAFNVVNRTLHPFKYIWEQITILSKEDILPRSKCKKAFDIFLDFTPTHLKLNMEKAFEISENYLCNIFTVKTSIYKLFGDIAFNAIKQVLLLVTDEEKKNLHPYWLAYLFERYTSCFYHCFELEGYKFLKIPLMTIDALYHIGKNERQSKDN